MKHSPTIYDSIVWTPIHTFEDTPGEIEAGKAKWLAMPVYCVPCWCRAGRPT